MLILDRHGWMDGWMDEWIGHLLGIPFTAIGTLVTKQLDVWNV